jgi:hypothetical protein
MLPRAVVTGLHSNASSFATRMTFFLEIFTQPLNNSLTAAHLCCALVRHFSTICTR